MEQDGRENGPLCLCVCMCVYVYVCKRRFCGERKKRICVTKMMAPRTRTTKKKKIYGEATTYSMVDLSGSSWRRECGVPRNLFARPPRY